MVGFRLPVTNPYLRYLLGHELGSRNVAARTDVPTLKSASRYVVGKGIDASPSDIRMIHQVVGS